MNNSDRDDNFYLTPTFCCRKLLKLTQMLIITLENPQVNIERLTCNSIVRQLTCYTLTWVTFFIIRKLSALKPVYVECTTTAWCTGSQLKFGVSCASNSLSRNAHHRYTHTQAQSINSHYVWNFICLGHRRPMSHNSSVFLWWYYQSRRASLLDRPKG